MIPLVQKSSLFDTEISSNILFFCIINMVNETLSNFRLITPTFEFSGHKKARKRYERKKWERMKKPKRTGRALVFIDCRLIYRILLHHLCRHDLSSTVLKNTGRFTYISLLFYQFYTSRNI